MRHLSTTRAIDSLVTSASLGSAAETPIWRQAPFRAYMAATAATSFAFSMQPLLVAWLFIGVLDTPANEMGLAQALIGAPGLLLMLWGGVSADRSDARMLVVRVNALSILPMLALALLARLDALSYWAVFTWALTVSVCTSYASAPLQAMLNGICGNQVQQGVTLSTAIGFGVQICALALAGQMEAVGIEHILLLQSVLIVVGCVLVWRLRPTARIAPTTPLGGVVSPPGTSVWLELASGVRMVLRSPLLLHVLWLNFLSMMFNAGAFAIVFPFIMMKVYGGDAEFLAWMMVVFWIGGTTSNFAMLKLMPIRHLGRYFLVMQLSRIAIMFLMWIEPPFWLLCVCIFLWGFNMGVTSTTARAIVQESAEPSHRGRVLSVFSIGFLGAQPFGALILGWCIAGFGVLNALLPGMLASVLIFGFGMWRTPLWRYTSPDLRVAAASSSS